MPYCPEYELRILEGDPGIDAHLEGCEGCRALASALAVVDMRMSWAVARAAMAPPVKPPLWPELLDVAGWTSVVATVLTVTVVVAPAALWMAFGGVMAACAAYLGFKAWREI